MKRPGRPSKTPLEERPIWARRIVSAREKSGLSQADLAKEIGISPSAMGDYETGRTRLSLDAATKMAAALKVKSSWIIDGASESMHGALKDFLLDAEEKLAKDPQSGPVDTVGYTTHYMYFISKIIAFLQESGVGRIAFSSHNLLVVRMIWMEVLGHVGTREMSTALIDEVLEKIRPSLGRFEGTRN